VYVCPGTRHYIGATAKANEKGEKTIVKAKQYVFSARTMDEGLRQLNEAKAKLNVGWDEFVIEAVSACYGLDKAALALPKKDTPAEPQKAEPAQGKKKGKAEAGNGTESGEGRGVRYGSRRVARTAGRYFYGGPAWVRTRDQPVI